MDRFYMNGAAALFKGASLLAISPICMCHDIHAGGVNYASWVQLTRKLRLEVLPLAGNVLHDLRLWQTPQEGL